jgi:integrase
MARAYPLLAPLRELRYRCGVERTLSVKLTTALLRDFEVGRDANARALQQLKLVRLMSVAKTPGRNPRVTVLEAWEVAVPELGTSVFVIPADRVKNGETRLVVLNRVAQAVIESMRGAHPQYVFTYRGKPIATMNNTAWQSARVRAGLPQVWVHDLKHTFGRRLRAVGVSFEDRQDLLGHKSGRITTHYSNAELQNLIDAANRVCADESRKSPALVLIRQTAVSA